MLRATVLSIVLTLVAAPNASELCQAWCDPAEAAATGCHQEDAGPSATLTGPHDCGQVVLDRAVLTNEDTRRGLSSPDTRHTVLVPRYQDVVASLATHPGSGPGCAWLVAQRFLVTALRI